MSIKYYHVEEEMSVYDIVITLYSSSEFLYRFMSDNKDKLPDGVETILAGMTVSYDNDFTNLFIKPPATYDEAIILGTQPTYITGVSWSSYELYSGYTVSTNILDNPQSLDIVYEFTPLTASNTSLSFDVDDTYVMAWSPTTNKINGSHNGNSTFTISADDRDGVIFETDTIYVENLRGDYEQPIFEQHPIPNAIQAHGLTYGFSHPFEDVPGTYYYDNGVSTDMWQGGTYGLSLPNGLITDGIQDFGFNDPLNQRVYASYSQTSLLATASHTDQYLHMTVRNFTPDTGFLEWGINDYISCRFFGSTFSVFSTNSGSTIDFPVEDFKFNTAKFLSFDLVWSHPFNLLRLYVNGKVVKVRGTSFDTDGDWGFGFPSSWGSNTNLYVTNVSPTDPSLPTNGSIMADDFWYASLSSGGLLYSDIQIQDMVREYLDEKFGI